MKKALITGITGQDGSYLADLLLDLGYEVHGIIRRSSSFNTARIDHCFDRLHLHYGDLSDGSTLARLIAQVEPVEIYNLAAQSHVRVSFDCPEYTCDVGALGTLRILEALRETEVPARFYQASSSEMFGNSPAPQNENTPFDPQSPYAAAKVFSYHIVRNYRDAYGLHASNGILFNHESPRRGETFVTRKITRAVARIKYRLQSKITLGNLEAKRDWGHAKDYVRGMHLMLQKDTPDDYVLATGETHSIREFLMLAFKIAGIEDWQRYVRQDKKYFRPTEVDCLRGDPSLAARKLGWVPEYSFRALVEEMLEVDMGLAIAEVKNG